VLLTTIQIYLFDHLAKSHFRNKIDSLAMEICALQAQVLQAMFVYPVSAVDAEVHAIKAKLNIYQRDMFHFYGWDKTATTALCSLARGTAVMPSYFANYGIVSVPNWVESRGGKYYLKDWDLATVLLNIPESHPVESALLWPLFPIAQCAGMLQHASLLCVLIIIIIIIIQCSAQ
jgi:hypothetical protein